MKKIALITLLLIFLIPIPGAGQHAMQGVVMSEESKDPLSAVFISARKNGKIIGNTYSGDDGSYLLNCPSQPDSLSFSLMGYKLFKCPANARPNPVFLVLAPFQLKSSGIKAPAVEVSGDTLSYQLFAFRQDGDRTLAEALVRMPGFSVSNNGTIYHDGRAISQFYIEGMDLLGGRYSIATNSIDPRDIAQVQVFRHHQKVKALKDLESSDRSAVNLVLKSTAKGTWARYLELLAGGAKDRFIHELAGTGAYFTPFGQSLLNLQSTSSGKSVTQILNDHFSPGGFLVLPHENDAQLSGALSPAWEQWPIPEETRAAIISSALTGNYLKKIDSLSTHRFWLDIAREQIEESYVKEHLIETESASAHYVEKKDAQDKRWFFSGGFLRETNNPAYFLSSKLTFSGAIKDHADALSGTNEISQQYRLPAVKAEYLLNYTKVKSPSKIFKVETRNILSYKNQQLFLGKDATLPEQRLEVFRYEGDHYIQLPFTGAKYYPLSLRTLYSRINGFNVGSIKIGLSPSVIKRFKKLQLSAGAPIGIKFVSSGDIVLDTSPYLSLDWAMTSRWSLSNTTSFSHHGSDEEDLYAETLIKNYRTRETKGALTKLSQYQESLSLKYSDLVSLRYGAVGLSLSGSWRDHSMQSDYTSNYSSFILIPELTSVSSWNFFAKWERNFGVDRLILRADVSAGRQEESLFLMGEKLRYPSTVIGGNLSFSTRPFSWLFLEGTVHPSYMRPDKTESTLFTAQFSGKIKVIPLPSFILQLEAFHYMQKGSSLSGIDRPWCSFKAQYSFKRMTILVCADNLLSATVYTNQVHPAFQTQYYSVPLRPFQCSIGLRASF